MNLDVQQGINFLKKESNFIKLRGVRKLATSKDRDALNILREFLREQPPQELADAAMEAIEELKNYFKRIDSVKIVDHKQQALDAQRNERARTLKVFDEKIQILAKRLDNEKSEYVRATLVKEIGRFKNLYTIDVLAKYLKDPDDRVRANTVEALAMIKNPLIIPHITPMLDDHSARVKANVLKALWLFGSQEILPHLESMMVAGSPADKRSALFVLKNIKTMESYRMVKEALSDPDLSVRETARSIIPEFGLLGIKSLIEGPLKLLQTGPFRYYAGGIVILFISLVTIILFMSSDDEEPRKVIIRKTKRDRPEKIVHYELAAKFVDPKGKSGGVVGAFENFDTTPVDADIPTDRYDRMQYYADNNKTYCQAMNLFDNDGDPATVIDLLLSALEEDPDNMWLQVYVYTMLDTCYFKMGDKEQARAAFNKASEVLQKIYDAKGLDMLTPKAFSDKLGEAFTAIGKAYQDAGSPQDAFKKR